MKNRLLVTLALLSTVATPAWSQQPAEMPDIPAPPTVMPAPPSAATPAAPVFDPTVPFDPAAPFNQPITPIRPQRMEVPQAQAPTSSGASAMPLPQDEEMFDFFQPGYQMEGGEKQEAAPEPEPVVPIAAPKKDDGPKKLPLVRFNYKNQYLPETIYKKQYDGHNKHLPTAYYPTDYERLAFAAAAANNVNGLRALMGAGVDPGAQNEHGESLAMIATRHGSHNVLRYLLAKGGDPYGAMPVAIRQNDGQAYYALKSAQ